MEHHEPYVEAVGFMSAFRAEDDGGRRLFQVLRNKGFKVVCCQEWWQVVDLLHLGAASASRGPRRSPESFQESFLREYSPSILKHEAWNVSCSQARIVSKADKKVQRVLWTALLGPEPDTS